MLVSLYKAIQSPCNETQNGFETQWPIPSLFDFGFEILGSLLFSTFAFLAFVCRNNFERKITHEMDWSTHWRVLIHQWSSRGLKQNKSWIKLLNKIATMDIGLIGTRLYSQDDSGTDVVVPQQGDGNLAGWAAVGKFWPNHSMSLGIKPDKCVLTNAIFSWIILHSLSLRTQNFQLAITHS